MARWLAAQANEIHSLYTARLLIKHIIRFTMLVGYLLRLGGYPHSLSLLATTFTIHIPVDGTIASFLVAFHLVHILEMRLLITSLSTSRSPRTDTAYSLEMSN